MAISPAPGYLPEGLQEFIARQLMESIITGALGSGDKLSPGKLAGEFGVSHIPVREALAALEAEGYVRRVPRVGFFVAELSPGYIEDVYHWRQVLEDEAHRIAVPRLEDSDIARMRAINSEINKGPTSENRFLDLNREFHFVAFERAESPILTRFLNHLWDAGARYMHTMDYARASRATLREHHDNLIAAFEARDVKRVNQLMAEHRALTLDSIRRITAGQKDHKKSSRDRKKSSRDGAEPGTHTERLRPSPSS
jgi:DNA-binding GntR family transcriptional regulator